MRVAVLLTTIYVVTSLPTRSAESDSYEDDNDSWECGTDAFTRYMSENQIELDCPKIKKTVNQCCVVHDKCYDDQLGRNHCDDTFCSCLDEVTKGYEICNKEDSPLFCGMVRQFGAEPYVRASNHSSPAQVLAILQKEEKLQYDNATETKSLAVHDYDYEIIVRANNTALDNSNSTGADLLEKLLQ